MRLVVLCPHLRAAQIAITKFSFPDTVFTAVGKGLANSGDDVYGEVTVFSHKFTVNLYASAGARKPFGAPTRRAAIGIINAAAAPCGLFRVTRRAA